jgi:hypothetical protein
VAQQNLHHSNSSVVRTWPPLCQHVSAQPLSEVKGWQLMLQGWAVLSLMSVPHTPCELGSLWVTDTCILQHCTLV